MAGPVQNHLSDTALSGLGLLCRFVVDRCRQAVHRRTTTGEGGGRKGHHERRRDLHGRRRERQRCIFGKRIVRRKRHIFLSGHRGRLFPGSLNALTNVCRRHCALIGSGGKRPPGCSCKSDRRGESGQSAQSLSAAPPLFPFCMVHMYRGYPKLSKNAAMPNRAQSLNRPPILSRPDTVYSMSKIGMGTSFVYPVFNSSIIE